MAGSVRLIGNVHERALRALAAALVEQGAKVVERPDGTFLITESGEIRLVVSVVNQVEA